MTNEKWTTQNIPEMQGKTVIITGANSGIGYEAVRALAAKNAAVVMACRSLDKGQVALEKIKSEIPQADLQLLALNLAELSSVRKFAQEFLAMHDRLDVLINNAGIMAVPYGKTADGFEMHFGTNHLGHFLLTGLLFELLKRTPNSRVVTVSSFAHYGGRINFENLNGEKSYQKWRAYSQSKLSNVLFAYELQRRVSVNGDHPISVVVHPGYSATNLQHTSWFFNFINPIMAQSQEMGALPTLFAATSPQIHGGEYVGPDGFMELRGHPHITKSSQASYDEETARKLWEVSEKLTGMEFKI